MTFNIGISILNLGNSMEAANAHASSLKNAETEGELIASKITSVKESKQDRGKNDAAMSLVSTSHKKSVMIHSKDINIKVTSLIRIS
jgi:hypothetical protein